jgi:hypothetical protein
MIPVADCVFSVCFFAVFTVHATGDIMLPLVFFLAPWKLQSLGHIGGGGNQYQEISSEGKCEKGGNFK